MSKKKKAQAPPKPLPLPEGHAALGWQETLQTTADTVAKQLGLPETPPLEVESYRIEPVLLPTRSCAQCGLVTIYGDSHCPPMTPAARLAAQLDAGAPMRISLPIEHTARRHFIDQAAIARFGAGYPPEHCYGKAELLWAAREKWLASKGGG